MTPDLHELLRQIAERMKTQLQCEFSHGYIDVADVLPYLQEAVSVARHMPPLVPDVTTKGVMEEFRAIAEYGEPGSLYAFVRVLAERAALGRRS